MLKWLYNFPNICIALLFGLIGGAHCLPECRFLRQNLLSIKEPRDYFERARNALTVVIGFTGVVLAFSLFQAQINLRNLETQVGTEAHNLSQMDRLKEGFAGRVLNLLCRSDEGV